MYHLPFVKAKLISMLPFLAKFCKMSNNATRMAFYLFCWAFINATMPLITAMTTTSIRNRMSLNFLNSHQFFFRATAAKTC